MKKQSILMLFTILPYPIRANGVSIRYFPIIQYLSKNHEIDLIFVDGRPSSSRNVEELQKYCRKVTVLSDPTYFGYRYLDRLFTYSNYVLPWNPPLSSIAHKGWSITRGIKEATKNKRYTSLIWVGSYLLPNLISALPSISADKVFVDFVDSPSLWAKRNKRKIFTFDFLERYERWKIHKWEIKTIRKVTSTIYISSVDAQTVPTRFTPGKVRYVIPNGIHVESYSKKKISEISSPNIGFLGNMSYVPNVEAVLWMYKEVFIPMKKLRPDLTLLIIGRDPDPLIQELKNKPDVIVTGTVDDIWGYVNAVDVFVFPLWTGAGLKNKILEAMYASRPVVTTPIGNEGIEAISGKDLIICEKSEDFIKEVQLLLNSPDIRSRIGSSAHTFVEEKFSWKRILKTYEKLIVENIAPSEQNFTERT
jgi:glycosyltransferase involved in cell wall biosynthesis